MGLWWLSFGKTKGVVIIEAEDAPDALQRAWDLSINPGGEVWVCKIDEKYASIYGPDVRNRLLPPAEAYDVAERTDNRSYLN